jgi:hypothetical protein
MVELVDRPDLNRDSRKGCWFDSRSEYKTPAWVTKEATSITPAQMVELVDTQDLKSCSR